MWKFTRATGAWTQISPIPSSSADDYFGYSGLTIDRQHPSTIMVATQVSWWPDAIFFRSTDGGATWTRIWDWDGYPNRSKRYTMDVSSVPWLTFGGNPQPPEEAPKLGWMNESVEIDPFDCDRMMYGTGATIYGTTNLTNWDTGGTVHHQADGQGAGGDRRARPDQPAQRRPADQRARRHRRLPAHRPGRRCRR